MSKEIFYAPQILDTMILPQEEANHCIKVMRKKEGDEILITDGLGHFHLASIISADIKNCQIKILETKQQPKHWNFELVVAFAPTKNMDRVEWFVEKATEIGIDAFIPFISKNSERKILKIERLQKILISASKQSQKGFFPKIHELTNFNNILTSSFRGQKFIAHCHKSEKTELTHTYKKNSSVLILIGPEGDFTEDEVFDAQIKGFEPISLIDARLRTETAALFATTAIQVLNI